MLFDQKSPVHREVGFPSVDRQTDIATYRLLGGFNGNTAYRKPLTELYDVCKE